MSMAIAKRVIKTHTPYLSIVDISLAPHHVRDDIKIEDSNNDFYYAHASTLPEYYTLGHCNARIINRQLLYLTHDRFAPFKTGFIPDRALILALMYRFTWIRLSPINTSKAIDWLLEHGNCYSEAMPNMYRAIDNKFLYNTVFVP